LAFPSGLPTPEGWSPPNQPPWHPPSEYSWQPLDVRAPAPFRPKFQNRTWLHVTLFVITVATTTLVGADHYYSFLSEFGRKQVPLHWGLLVPGLWYSLTILGILGAHEMGHYIYCRRYNVDATLPFFLPLPLPFSGTLGAVIKIREPFPNRTALFDIGVAGPIAGFLVLVPALFIGLSMSSLAPTPTEGQGWLLGRPLLFRWAVNLMFGPVPQGMSLNMHPMVFASWFGMLATAVNLLPFGQLDGGHITYATLRRYSTPLSIATATTAVVMTWVSTSWMLLAVMMLLMLVLLGPRHPRVINEWHALPTSRYAVALFALIILIVCFTPVPLTPHDF
jgi:membrane-associated protease RseP (regulator of RpoE activity)